MYFDNFNFFEDFRLLPLSENPVSFSTKPVSVTKLKIRIQAQARR